MAADKLKELLLDIQKEAPKVPRVGWNEYTGSHFMTLQDVYSAVVPMLSERDILWTTFPTTGDLGQASLEYGFTHLPTKEELTRVVPLPLNKGTAQDMGSAITYMKRYCLVAALNLIADSDDDGHAATEAAKLPEHKAQTTPAAAQPTEDEQLELRQSITDLTVKLKKHKTAWEQTAAWAKEREIPLESPPADKLRAVERALRTKLERVEAEAAKKAPKAAAK